ncbi:MAG: asparagine synthase (glutamine-hydrolyzing) [Cyanobacteriota bacterium]
MCGICGIIGSSSEEIIKKMSDALYHRGPDEVGYYFSEKICLCNRRLSIIDLQTGTQPIYNEDKSIVVVFNGEIYNFQAIRDDLEKKGHIFTTKTDTEVIVHAYEEFGTECLRRFNGDFAFSLYDSNKDITFIARDRLGIRPLYYSHLNDKILFASELKALLASGMINKELNYNSINKYLTLRYCFGTDTFFKSVKKLPPASYMLIKDNNIIINKFWDIDYTPVYYKSYRDYIDRFEEIFENSVKLRMISDVPFGAFLSGGVDSSFIVAMMAKHSNVPVETYSIGFNLDIDETSDSKKLANHFGCNHHEIMIENQSYDLIPEIVKCLDEPLGDSIIIPTYLLNREAAKSLKVVLTGEGADEIFGGYVHQIAMHYGSVFNKYTPEFITNNILIPSITKSPMQLLDKLFPYPSGLGQKGKEKLLKYLSNISNIENSYFSIASVFSPIDKSNYYHPAFVERLNNLTVNNEFAALLNKNRDLPVLNQLIDLDTKYWLADYTLFKQDRLTMANSIEGRIPYLDHNLVEFVAQIPINYKINGINTKYLLRKVAKSYLPKPTAFRPKRAFYFPYQKCFGKNFNIYLKELFNENSFIFNMEIIRKGQLDYLCQNALKNELLQSKQLMSIIILEHWLKIYS